MESVPITSKELAIPLHHIFFYFIEFLTPHILENHIHLNTYFFEDFFGLIDSYERYESFFLDLVFAD